MKRTTLPWRELTIGALVVLLNLPLAFKFGAFSQSPLAHEAFAEGAPYPTPTPAPGEDFNPDQSCGDGVDNDQNGLTDCADPSCFPIGPCSAPTPTTSQNGLIATVLLLLVVGGLAITRRQVREED